MEFFGNNQNSALAFYIYYFVIWVMTHTGKNITLTLIVALYCIIAFTGQFVPGYGHNYIIASAHSAIGAATHQQPMGSQPRVETLKTRPSVIKVEIQTGIVVPPHLFPTFQDFIRLRTAEPYRLHPQIAYVRYLPRDPPIA